MKRVFISYSVKDVQIAKDVFDILRRLGMDVWLDIYEIGPGDDINRRIEDGIKSSQLFVAIITPNSVGSNWVSKELKLALEVISKKGENGVIPIIPDGTIIPDYIKNIDPIIISPFDYQEILYRDLSRVVERIFRDRPYDTNIWSGDQYYVKDISKELSDEFPAKRKYRPEIAFQILTDAGQDQEI